MRKLMAAAAAALTAVIVATPAPSHAAPALSWWSDDFSEDQNVCVDRAKGAFAQEGWTGIAVQGTAGISVNANKGKLAAVILCIDASVIVVVSGGDGDLAPNERDRLKYYMKD
jgi:hypothetical protein